MRTAAIKCFVPSHVRVIILFVRSRVLGALLDMYEKILQPQAAIVKRAFTQQKLKKMSLYI